MAMRIASAATTAMSADVEREIFAGSSASRMCGSGREPSTLSTAILSGRTMVGQENRACARSRRYSARSLIRYLPLLGPETLDRAADRGHGSHCLPERVEDGEHCTDGERQRRPPHVGSSTHPGEAVKRERDERSTQGDDGPPTQSHQLLRTSMILDAHHEPRPAENPSADLQIPGIVVATHQHAGVVGA